MKPLYFSEEIPYEDNDDGIPLRVKISYGDTELEVTAKVDPGAGVCLFNHEDGLDPGIPIEQGEPIWLGGLTGSMEAFGHQVTLQTGELIFQSTVYFAKYPGVKRNLLGRQGWLRNLRLAVIDYDNLL
ncbi:MAG TPA: hypothetical protein PLD20_32790 [Blastocatellia bacterium]|nr:hypothetical protein [Blastocatellia bacterium]HMV83813.1 hypothetical protein [Blastocatellia bacterium]HMX29397.1 hypothetical protein [Blastocatellia bacterium]HMY75113.1 hypothetical protein [Blastocatellia bacterium]HMZ22751.1 hypothetical protein [Blastocatellia bacterium]